MKTKVRKVEVLYPKVVYVEAVIMANGEVIHYGKTLGFANKKQIDLLEAGANKLTRGSEDVIALNGNIA